MGGPEDFIDEIRWVGIDEAVVLVARRSPDGWHYESAVANEDGSTVGFETDFSTAPLEQGLRGLWPLGCSDVEVDGITAEQAAELFSPIVGADYDVDEGFGLNGRFCFWNGAFFVVEQ